MCGGVGAAGAERGCRGDGEEGWRWGFLVRGGRSLGKLWGGSVVEGGGGRGVEREERLQK